MQEGFCFVLHVKEDKQGWARVFFRLFCFIFILLQRESEGSVIFIF